MRLCALFHLVTESLCASTKVLDTKHSLGKLAASQHMPKTGIYITKLRTPTVSTVSHFIPQVSDNVIIRKYSSDKIENLSRKVDNKRKEGHLNLKSGCSESNNLIELKPCTKSFCPLCKRVQPVSLTRKVLSFES